MKLLFKQRFFSLLDSYDIYSESGKTEFVVKGRFALKHKLEIYSSNDRYLGMVEGKAVTLLPSYKLYAGERCMGQISKKFSIFKPLFTLDFNNWTVLGDWRRRNYTAFDGEGRRIMTASKKLLNWTDTYVIDVESPEDALLSLMIVLVIDAAKATKW